MVWKGRKLVYESGKYEINSPNDRSKDDIALLSLPQSKELVRGPPELVQRFRL
jgi:hypothetical protein